MRGDYSVTVGVTGVTGRLARDLGGELLLGAAGAAPHLIVLLAGDRPVKASPSGGRWPALTGLAILF